MNRKFTGLLLMMVHIFIGTSAFAQTTPVTLEELKAQIDTLKADYEKRIRDLETQVQQLQVQALAEDVAAEEPAGEVATTQPVGRQSFPGVLNPAISVIGNFVTRGDTEKVFNEEGDRIDNKLNLREVEIDFRVPVDPYADGVLIAAFESEFPGEFEVGVEEGYVNIKKLPFVDVMPGGLRLKIGRFRPLFGRLNILHTHDLPTTFRPLPVEEFLGEEGFVQNGASAAFFLPTPWDPAASVDLTLEVMDGGNIAVSSSSDARIAYLGHARYFKNFAAMHDVELGFSTYFHPSGNELQQARLHGFDFMYRWKPLRRGQWRSYIFGAEVMFAPDINPEEPAEGEQFGILQETDNGRTPWGFTAFNQWQFNRRLYAGLRFDHTDSVVDTEVQRRSITPYLSYYFSEFLRLRLNYERRWSDIAEEDNRNSVFLELNWVFGSHPPEPFWVNR